MNKQIKFLVLVIIFVLLIQIVLAEEEVKEETTVNSELSGNGIEINQEEGISTVTFTGEDSFVNVGDDLFKDIKPKGEENEAYIKLDENGEVQKADITASADASFVFGEKRIDVKEGTRVFYQNGKITIFGEKDDEVALMDKVTDENGESSFSNENSVIILDEQGKLFIEDNIIRGTDFQIGDLRVRAVSATEIGKVELVPEGYLLGDKSIGEWKGMSLMTDDNLLLANSEQGLENYESWVFPEERRLRAKGDGFEILFNENNGWARVDSNDNFAVKAGEGFEMKLENRDVIHETLDGLIPKMEVGGEFVINQDYKSIYTENGEIMVKREGTIFNSGANEFDSTSPIELFIKDPEGNLNQEKYIVSNFKGIAAVPLYASEGISDERYANSIYSIRSRIDNRYNYPTIEDFELISGKTIVFGDELNQPEYVRALIDIYQSNPQNSFRGITTVKILDWNEYPGSYHAEEESIHIQGKNKINQEFPFIIHEQGHAIHYDIARYTELRNINLRIEGKEDFFGEGSPFSETDLENEIVRGMFEENQAELRILKEQKEELLVRTLPIDSEWENTLAIDYPDITFITRSGSGLYEHGGLVWDWDESGDEKLKQIISEQASNGFGIGETPYGGFVRPYGASNIKEDIATFREKVIGDPLFFRERGLLEPSEGNLMYDPSYKQKIDLLLKYGFITDDEYNAVFNPEEYGLE
jgi:hypothetical protein